MVGFTRSHPKGLADLLNYAALVDEGICWFAEHGSQTLRLEVTV